MSLSVILSALTAGHSRGYVSIPVKFPMTCQVLWVPDRPRLIKITGVGPFGSRQEEGPRSDVVVVVACFRSTRGTGMVASSLRSTCDSFSVCQDTNKVLHTRNAFKKWKWRIENFILLTKCCSYCSRQIEPTKCRLVGRVDWLVAIRLKWNDCHSRERRRINLLRMFGIIRISARGIDVSA